MAVPVNQATPDIMSSLLFYAGPVFSVALQASSLQAAVKLAINRSTGGMSPIPFVAVLANGCLWLYYGLMKWDMVIIFPNAVGTLVGLACVACYEYVSKVRNAVVYITTALILLGATYAAMQGMDTIVGYAGSASTLLMLASPLSAMGTVIRDKSTASLPFSMCLMSLFSGLSWGSYGLLIANDPLIYAPSLLGSVLAVVQLSMFVLYGFAGSATKPFRAPALHQQQTRLSQHQSEIGSPSGRVRSGSSNGLPPTGGGKEVKSSPMAAVKQVAGGGSLAMTDEAVLESGLSYHKRKESNPGK